MTRDEAKKKINIQKSEVYPYGIIDNVDSVIDEIFDSFENRKCSNCLSKRYCDVVTQDEDNFYCSDWELEK